MPQKFLGTLRTPTSCDRDFLQNDFKQIFPYIDSIFKRPIDVLLDLDKMMTDNTDINASLYTQTAHTHCLSYPPMPPTLQ